MKFVDDDDDDDINFLKLSALELQATVQLSTM